MIENDWLKTSHFNRTEYHILVAAKIAIAGVNAWLKGQACSDFSVSVFIEKEETFFLVARFCRTEGVLERIVDMEAPSPEMLSIAKKLSEMGVVLV